MESAAYRIGVRDANDFIARGRIRVVRIDVHIAGDRLAHLAGIGSDGQRDGARLARRDDERIEGIATECEIRPDIPARCV